MLVRWNYKLQPNKTQLALMGEWLVTLRKHRNFMLAERKQGFEDNNQNCDEPLSYAYGAYCDLDTKTVYGSCCPLTCAVMKHGVVPKQLSSEQLIKNQKAKEIRKMLDGYGLTISSLAFYPNPLHPEADHRETVISHLKKVIEGAALLETPIVGTFIGKDKNNLKEICRMDDSMTAIPNNQMVMVLSQEFHYQEWWPTAPFKQNFIPFPKNDLIGKLLEVEID